MASGLDVGVRLAEVADAREIAVLHASSWRRHYRGAYSDGYLDGDLEAERLGVWTERLSGPGERITVAARDGAALVGFAHLVLDADPTWGALVDNLHVLNRFQGTGIGTRLLAATAQMVVDRRPGSGAYLWVLEQNEAARGFYLSRNGTPDETQPVPPPGGNPSNLEGSPCRLRIAWRDPTVLIGATDPFRSDPP